MGRLRKSARFAALAVLLAAAAEAQPTPATPDAPPPMEAPAATAEVQIPESTTADRVSEADEPASLPPDTATSPAPASTLPPELPHDLSPWGMFMAADIVVKAVMIGLAIASLVTWTVCLAKSLEILAASARLSRSLRVILGVHDLEAAERALAGARGPAALMVRAARQEASATSAIAPHGLLPRVASHLSRIEAGAGRRLAKGTGILATIGATAPFVGLLGTVWGIMNSFIGISESRTTNLAVVAPGIAEALLATALGLVAAIPAVVIYNLFARWIAGYRARLADAAAGVERLVSRDLDHDRLASAPLAQAAE